MSKHKKNARTLKILIAVVLVLLVLEVTWLMFAQFGEKKPLEQEVTEPETVQQEETQATEPSETETAAAMPWDEPGALKPEEYTWEDYEFLTGDQQKAFREFLGEDGFAAWLDTVRDQAEINPWEESGAKKPEDYTLEEFEALTGAQQIAFQEYLGLEAFEDWLSRVQEQSEKNPWDEPGAKQPADYTLEEFEALTAAQQMAFQQHLGAEGFEAWLNKVQNNAEQNPWEKPGAKQPQNYTYAEFEALTAAQQMAFQEYLGLEAFEDWLSRVQGQTEKNPWDEPGAKRPEDYTYEEFEALTAAQQMAFQDYLGVEGFAAWLDRVQEEPMEKNPWDEPGAKRPEDYTYEEFEALTAAQRMAFQNYLGEEAFEEWLNRVLGG